MSETIYDLSLPDLPRRQMQDLVSEYLVYRVAHSPRTLVTSPGLMMLKVSTNQHFMPTSDWLSPTNGCCRLKSELFPRGEGS